MGRKSGIGSFILKAAKMSIKEAERQAREQERERLKELKAYERLTEKNEKILEKSRKKAAQENEKYIFHNLTPETIQKFGLGQLESKKTNYSFDPDLEGIIQLVIEHKGDDIFFASKKIKLSDVDHFLFSGKFNSVLGLDGFKIFKEQLKKIIESVNTKSNKSNLINLDDLYEVLLRSGVYYELKFLPSDMNEPSENEGWLTAYRFISKNFADISYKDFRTVVKNFTKTVGNTLEFDQDEVSSTLYKKIAGSSLFISDSSPSSILSTLGMGDLRAICSDLNISSARSKEETINKLTPVEGISGILKERYSNKFNSLVFRMKDSDLVNAKDIEQLDKYLRKLAQNVQGDLFDFVENKTNYKLAV